MSAIPIDVDLDGLEAGDQLPALVKLPTTEQLVRYAGAANDYARIHFDAGHAVERGFDGVIVHGLLKAGFLGQLVTTWCGPGAWVKRFSAQYRRVDRPGRPLICQAKVTGKRVEGDAVLVDLDLWTEDAERRVTTKGTATVVFPTRGANP
jgi:acyl dehydratase